MNSVRNKFKFLVGQVKVKIDILMILQTKIGESFPQGNLLIDGFSSPYRLDRDPKFRGFMSYIKDDIASNFGASDNKSIESLYVELNFQNAKVLIN